MVIDAGPTHYQKFATVVRIDEDRWTIERPGVVDARHSRGNVQPDHPVRLHGQHLPQSRWPRPSARSCWPTAGLPARRARSPRIRDPVRRRGGHQWRPRRSPRRRRRSAPGRSLENHRSRRIAANLVRQADCIFAMTADHLDDLLRAMPEVEPRAFLLDPGGGDVADPVGCDHETYRRTAQMIESMLTRRLDEMGV